MDRKHLIWSGEHLSFRKFYLHILVPYKESRCYKSDEDFRFVDPAVTKMAGSGLISKNGAVCDFALIETKHQTNSHAAVSPQAQDHPSFVDQCFWTRITSPVLFLKRQITTTVTPRRLIFIHNINLMITPQTRVPHITHFNYIIWFTWDIKTHRVRFR